MADSMTFDAVYEGRRGDLYRALVLITDDRDISVDAIDRAFGRWFGRFRKRGAAGVEAAILGDALRWIDKRRSRRNPELRGFRLPEQHAALSARPLVQAFQSLDTMDRAALVGRHLLKWDDGEVGVLTSRDAADAAALVRAAETRLASAAGGTSVDRLGELLEALAGEHREPLRRADTVKARARMRKAGLVAGAAVALAAVVGVAGVAVNALRPGETVDSTQAAGTVTTRPGGGAVPATGAPPGVEVPDLEWTQVGLPIREGDVSGVAHGDEGFVVLAHDYSRARSSTVVFRSQDGVEWEQLASPPVADSGWIHSIQYVAGKYIAIGNEFDERAGRDSPKVWISEDGEFWDETALPVEREIEVAGDVMPVSTYLQSATGGADGITVLGSQQLEMDPERLLRDALPEGVNPSGGWSWGPSGVEIYDNNGNVTFRAAWDDLDIDPQLIRLITGGRTILWTSQDGLEWEQSVLDIDFGFDGGVGTIVAGDGVRAAQVWARFGPQIWIEKDGAWDQVRIPGANALVALAGSDGRIVVAGARDDGAGVIWSSADGENWEPAEGVVAGTATQLFSSGGTLLAIVQEGAVRPMGPAVLDVDGYTVEITQSGIYRVLEGDIEIASVAAEDAERGNDTVTILDDQGEPIVTFSERDVELAWEQVFREFEGGFPEQQGPPPVNLLASNDGGRTWTDLRFSEVSGGGFYPSGAAWDGTTFILAGFAEGGGFREGPPPVAVWVGTPAG